MGFFLKRSTDSSQWLTITHKEKSRPNRSMGNSVLELRVTDFPPFLSQVRGFLGQFESLQEIEGKYYIIDYLNSAIRFT